MNHEAGADALANPEKTPLSRHSRFCPPLAAYLYSAVAEFELISAERKSMLDQLARYVQKQQQRGLTARLMFVCTHNSRRSQLSQVWAKVAADWWGIERVETHSGGTESTAFDPRAVAALRRSGLQIVADDERASNPHYQTRVSENAQSQTCFSKRFDSPANPASGFCAVMNCAEADASCPVVAGAELRLAVRYDDPKLADGTPEEEARYDERSRQICREMLYLFSRVGKD